MHLLLYYIIIKKSEGLLWEKCKSVLMLLNKKGFHAVKRVPDKETAVRKSS